MCHKRIEGEYRCFLNHPLSKQYCFLLDSTNKINDDNIIIYINKNNNNSINNSNNNSKPVLLFKITNQYPFKPPKLYIYNFKYNNYDIDYNRWSYENGEKFNNIIKNLNLSRYDILLLWFFIINKNINYLYKKPIYSLELKQECFCCSTIICSGNWSPSYKITDIFLEYYLRKELFTFSNKLTIRYLQTIFNNDKWDLSMDIVEHILNMLF
jgi:ubiquitin-protein ligase